MRTLFLAYIVVKNSIYFVLQIVYINLQAAAAAANNSTDAHQRNGQIGDNSETVIRDYRLFMQQCGLVFRELESTAVLIFGSTILLNLVFSLGDKLTSGWLLRMYLADGFFLFHHNRQLSDERVVASFDRYLHRMLVLNLSKRETISKNYQHHLCTLEEANQLINDLNSQQGQLRAMLDAATGDKLRLLWADNRQEPARQEQARFVNRLYGISYVMQYISTLMLVYFGEKYAYEQLQILHHENDGERGYRLNWMEKLSLAEVYLLLYVGDDAFITPLVLLIANLRDKRQSLRDIRQHFIELHMMLTELRTTIFNNNEQGMPIIIKQPAPPLKAACDLEALRLYLRLRVFIDQMKPTTRLASNIVNQYCLIAPSILAPYLLLRLHRTLGSQPLLLAILGLFYATCINTAFAFCADLESICLKTVQFSWSLVAKFTVDLREDCARNDDDDDDDDVDIKLVQTTAHEFIIRDRLVLPSLRSHRQYFLMPQREGSLINAHTSLLWRRLVLDLQTLDKRFYCYVVGNIKLSFQEMLRLNFWFISVVLTILMR